VVSNSHRLSTLDYYNRIPLFFIRFRAYYRFTGTLCESFGKLIHCSVWISDAEMRLRPRAQTQYRISIIASRGTTTIMIKPASEGDPQSLVPFSITNTEMDKYTDARSLWRLNFLRWRLIFVDPQYGTCFMSPFCFQNFKVASRLSKICAPCYNKLLWYILILSSLPVLDFPRGFPLHAFVFLSFRNCILNPFLLNYVAQTCQPACVKQKLSLQHTKEVTMNLSLIHLPQNNRSCVQSYKTAVKIFIPLLTHGTLTRSRKREEYFLGTRYSMLSGTFLLVQAR
jgi:hypothetical protein